MGRGEVGHAVAEERKRRGLSQERLAALAGVTRVTLSRVEHGDEKVQERTLDAVLRAIGLDDLVESRPGAGLTDDELISEMERRHPGVFAAVEAMLAGREEPDPGRKQRHSGVKPPDVTHQGDPAPAKSQRRASGV